MRRWITMGVLMLMAGCAERGFEGGSCQGAGFPAFCGGERGIALCGTPVCSGEGLAPWEPEWSANGLLCNRAGDGAGRPACERPSDEGCWTEEELREICDPGE